MNFKVSFTQSELDELFGEEVVLVEGGARRVTKNDVLQKLNLNSDFEVELLEEEQPTPKDYTY